MRHTGFPQVDGLSMDPWDLGRHIKSLQQLFYDLIINYYKYVDVFFFKKKRYVDVNMN